MRTRPRTGFGLQGTAYVSEQRVRAQKGPCFLRERIKPMKAAQPVTGRQHLFQMISMFAPPTSICTLGHSSAADGIVTIEADFVFAPGS